ETVTSHAEAAWLRAALRFAAKAAGAAYDEIPAGANAIGLARAGVLPIGQGADARAQLAQPCKGHLLYGIESPLDFADGAAAWKAFAAAGNVVAFSAYASDALRQVASVILPIGLLPEIDATLTNLDGIEQSVSAGARLPGEARPGWKVLRALGAALALDGFGFTTIDEVRARIDVAGAASPGAPAARREVAPTAGTLQRIATSAIYRSDAVVRRAPALAAHPLTRGARVSVNPADALALGLGHGVSARVDGVVLPVDVDSRVARGAALVEGGYAETALLAPQGASLKIGRA
ncbi:MAG: molybdopterin-dependent oxidoreductase, partial [Xanthomonadales bacterium]|nr:molybdopterin-dependent oxidoreductase [Xanthomonadales bacterium]